MIRCLDVFARVKIKPLLEGQITLERNLTLSEKINLCHSHIPQMRHIEGFLDTGLIVPLPIWSPIPEKYQKITRDKFSVVGLEAQDPKYLPEALKPFVKVAKRGKHCYLQLLEGAIKGKGERVCSWYV
jgi:hypothetical protein